MCCKQKGCRAVRSLRVSKKEPRTFDARLPFKLPTFQEHLALLRDKKEELKPVLRFSWFLLFGGQQPLFCAVEALCHFLGARFCIANLLGHSISFLSLHCRTRILENQNRLQMSQVFSVSAH
jgi:hypothetical protein